MSLLQALVFNGGIFMEKPKVLVALGSPSDRRLLEGITFDEDVFYAYSGASAHRTPALVRQHAAEGWDAIVAGAGLTNALVSEYVKDAAAPTLVIGVPIYDRATGGLTSLLSSSELPSGYVVATVGVGQLPQAVNLASVLVTRRYTGVFISAVAGYHRALDKDFYSEKSEQLPELLNRFGIPYRFEGTSDKEPRDGELVLFMDGTTDPLMNPIEERFGNYADVVVATKMISLEEDMSPQDYLRYVDRPSNALFVGLQNPAHLALFAAKVISRQRPEVAEKIRKYQEEGKTKYKPYQDLIPLTPKSLGTLLER